MHWSTYVGNNFIKNLYFITGTGDNFLLETEGNKEQVTAEIERFFQLNKNKYDRIMGSFQGVHGRSFYIYKDTQQ